MVSHAENCLICGAGLVYSATATTAACHLCGAQHQTNALCSNSHYVCDTCHATEGIVFIGQHAGTTSHKNPVAIATEMMRHPGVKMHGPEHHYLAVAALLAAYRNAGGVVDLAKALENAEQRAKKVPGGICGLWGSCGAGIGTGIFISLVTGATPLSGKEWSLANTMTSRSLDVIANHGGPRCCKRNTWLALLQAAAYAGEQFQIIMEVPDSIVCEFSHRNKQCRNTACPFFAENDTRNILTTPQ